MRAVLLGLAIVIAALAANARTSHAQYNARYCTDGAGDGNSGDLQCAYNTMQQCREAASGTGMHCTENPDVGWRERGSSTEGRRSGRQRNN